MIYLNHGATFILDDLVNDDFCRGGLLEQIAPGKQLKAAPAPAPKPVDARYFFSPKSCRFIKIAVGPWGVAGKRTLFHN